MANFRAEDSLMFARLLIYAGFLAFLCFGLVGCEAEDPQIVKEVAELVKTVPASGEYAADALPVVLYFDKEPLAVTVNRTAARVEGNTAFWYFPKPPPYGDELFHIEWTNPDGSPNVGADIRLTVVKAEVAELVKTIPASGGDNGEFLPIVLYFDKEPLAVTVNGTAARVEGKRAFWCFPELPSLGDQLFHIEWTNPDGSPNVGTDIRLTVWHVNHSEPSITSGSVADGAADADSDLLNRDGIRFDFDESVIDFGSQLAAEDGENLDWETVWDDQTVIFRPGANGKLLENGKRYMIHLAFAPAWMYHEISCECMDCSLYGNYEWTIGFITADE